MFGMGTGELLLVLLIALLVFGPKKLPDLAKGLGKAIREFRRASTDLQEQIQVDSDLGPAMREVQAAATGMPSPHELNAAHKPPEQPTVPAPAPATETVSSKPAAEASRTTPAPKAAEPPKPADAPAQPTPPPAPAPLATKTS
jgi:sec-independent protein translocase protein TatB